MSVDYLRYDDNQPRNKRGQTLDEYIDQLRHVHATLKADLFFHMSQKRFATDVIDYLHHDKAIRRISKAKLAAERRGREYGITLT